MKSIFDQFYQHKDQKQRIKKISVIQFANILVININKVPGIPAYMIKLKLCPDLLQNFFYYLIPRYLGFLRLLSLGVVLTGTYNQTRGNHFTVVFDWVQSCTTARPTHLDQTTHQWSRPHFHQQNCHRLQLVLWQLTTVPLVHRCEEKSGGVDRMSLQAILQCSHLLPLSLLSSVGQS